jgi:hypothetical protein
VGLSFGVMECGVTEIGAVVLCYGVWSDREWGCCLVLWSVEWHGVGLLFGFLECGVRGSGAVVWCYGVWSDMEWGCCLVLWSVE